MIKNGKDLLFLVFFNALTHVCTLCFRKRAILMHSCFVTYTLVSIIIDIKHVFKRLQIPMANYRKAILIFSFFYQVCPLLITVYKKMNMHFMYVHLCVCFIIHLLHMHYVTVVFRVMNYNDSNHWMILFFVNLLEMCTNLCLVCNYEDIYVLVAVVTECICPYVLMYIRKKSRNSVERFVCLNTTSPPFVNNRRVIVCSTASLNDTNNLNSENK